MGSFVHLHVHSPFSFLDGAGELERLVEKAAALKMPALAITDHNNVCAAVRFAAAAKRCGIKAIQGAELSLQDGSHLTLLAAGASGYGSLCRLLTRAHLSSPRENPCGQEADLADLEDVFVLSGCRRGRIPGLLLRGRYRQAEEEALRWRDIFGRERFFLELQSGLLPGDRQLNCRLAELGSSLGLELVASNNVHYVEHEDYYLHDILCCIRNLHTLGDISPERPLNGEQYLKSGEEMVRLLVDYPRACSNTLRLAEACDSPFRQRSTHFPRFPVPAGESAAGLLRRMVMDGAQRRYGKLSGDTVERIRYELSVIEQLDLADYFLVVWDLARYAREQGVRYAGRGSAADSLVAYCLYITEVDSLKRGLLFERFISLERQGMPDIDIDFESRRRDQVINYVYEKYGARRVARVATYNSFRARSALREIGKALGFSEQELGPLARRLPSYTFADNIRPMLDLLPELKDSPLKEKRYDLLIRACERLAGFPRFLGMHLGGVVVSDVPLTELTVLQRSAMGPLITQFDKDDVEDVGLIKLDLLSLRTLSVVQQAVGNINAGGTSLDYDNIPLDDPETYERIRSGQTLGMFQIESPAQRALQARLEADNMEDMVASMALIRPGPIKGNMVEPYISRRQGREAVTYPHPRLEPILAKTYGVVLFQEQVLEIARAIAGFTAGEADRLRRVMTHARSQKHMGEIGEEFVRRAVENGVERCCAEEIFASMLGYASYGFCEAHAAAFATTSFKTAYLIRHHPAEYYAAILNHQPMGYYPSRIIVNEARRHGIAVLPPDINLSHSDFTVQEGAIRVGLKQVKGLSRQVLELIAREQEKGRFSSWQDAVERLPVPEDMLENLVKCGALDSLSPNRRWNLSILPALLANRESGGGLALFATESLADELADFSEKQRREMAFGLLEIEIGEHVMASWRDALSAKGIVSSRELASRPDGSIVSLAGMLFRPHRPPTRSGRITVFFSLEDEFGLADVTMFEDVYMRCGSQVYSQETGPLLVRGLVQRRGRGLSIVARAAQRLHVKPRGTMNTPGN